MLQHAEIKLLIQYGFYMGLGFVGCVAMVKCAFYAVKKVAGLGGKE